MLIKYVEKSDTGVTQLQQKISTTLEDSEGITTRKMCTVIYIYCIHKRK